MHQSVSKITIDKAYDTLQGVIKKTPLEYCARLSEKFASHIYLKREDLQIVRSYKIRGAYNLMSSLTSGERKKGVVCASAGNHAQGVALSASLLKIKATIFMPVITPLQKINKVKAFGKSFVDIVLFGVTYDESYGEALAFCREKKKVFVHPFNDERTISGQGTVGKEIAEDLGEVDFCLVPVGGGGLISGVGTYLKSVNKSIKIFGVEPLGAAAMDKSLKKGELVKLDTIDTFADGVAVKSVGDITFKLGKSLIDEMVIVPEGKICVTMIEMYQNEGIILEPAGALSIAALDTIYQRIKGKRVVCILSGGNNDIMRYPEVVEKSLIYQGLKHYFLVEFAQKPGQLRKFVDSALGPNDDIVRFEYIKKTSKEMGPAFVGIEVAKKEDIGSLMKRMEKIGLSYTKISPDDPLFSYLV